MQRLDRSLMTLLGVYLVTLTFALSAPALSQTRLFAYPQAGQSQQQQMLDHGECHQWAMQQSGFDPNRPPPQVYATYSSPPPSNQGGALRGAAGGAALGAVGGAIAGDAGKGAAIGAATGALFGAMRRRQAAREQQEWQQYQDQQMRQQQQAIAQQQAMGQQTYNRAYAACMQARAYVVQ